MRLGHVSHTALGCALVGAALAAVPAAAQITPVPNQADSPPDNIIVTAQRRSDNIRDVPISISAISGDIVSSLTVGGEDIRALAGRVPNLNVESTFGRVFPRFYIRGLGNSDFTLNSTASVSVYYDDVVLENQILRSMPAFDLERVEVLRGPQGTLYGRNSTAGAVKLISQKPTDTVQGYGRVSYGRFNTTSFEGAIGGPIVNDLLSGRMSLLYQRQGGSVENIVTGHKLGGYDDIAARAQLLFEPDDRFSALLQFSARSLNGTSTLFNGRQTTPGFGVLPFKKLRIALESDRQSDQEAHQYGLNLNLTYDLGGVDLTSITSWQSGDFFTVGDVDGSPRAALINTSRINGLDQVTEELRLASKGDGAFNWQAGVYYFHELLDYSNTTANNTFQTSDGSPGFGAYQFAQQKSESYAGFAQASYKIIDALTLSGGIRYTHDRIRLSQDTAFFTPNPADLTAEPNFSGPFYAGGARGPFPVTQPRFSSAGEGSGRVTWDGSLTYKINPQVNVYARIARGYHSGVITGQAIFSPIETAGPETVTSYEVGLKSEFLDRKIRLNLTGFHYVYKDQQLPVFIRNGSGADIIRLINAPGGKGTGFEGDIQIRPSPYFAFGGQIGYVDTRISGRTLVQDPRSATGQVDIDGQPFPFAPKLTAGLNADAKVPVGERAELFASTDWSYRSSQNFSLTSFLQPEFRTGGWWEGGVRAGYRIDTLEVALWSRNVADSTGFTSGLNVNGLAYVFNAPRTYGVEVSYRF
ncbi:TonB-dependent receptor [Sphingobium sp. CR2-8]|uniref:TonB-dependent receptor n=1 Tax=Sphingobium sp. CR2-8 TaxID=1306534 RepID=UPI002DB55A17|nr:TonB-dependent receptor [Sphingobium sp. CR2-8]MEC3909795.1 TonB-dependent receptor [Sphingobium sp. CR2-8]